MSAEFPSLSEVLTRHSESEEGCCYACCTEDSCGVSPNSHAEHQAAAWREVCTIRTAEQLAALPSGSAIREIDCPVPGTFELQEQDEVGEEAAWYVVGDNRPDQPRLPALLLSHPAWRTP